MPGKKGSGCLVVFSGGQDSTTCLHWALNRFAEVRAIFFDYGQRHLAEARAARKITGDLGVLLFSLKVDAFRRLGGNALVDAGMRIRRGAGGLPNTFVPGRNLVFLTLAAAYAWPRGIRDLVGGMCQTDYSGYPDCRRPAIGALQRSLGLGMDAPLRIHTPLMNKTKAQSVRLARRLGAMDSLAWSHTCYEGRFPPCGRCPACRLRARGFREAGIRDPLLIRAG